MKYLLFELKLVNVASQYKGTNRPVNKYEVIIKLKLSSTYIKMVGVKTEHIYSILL